MKMSYIAALGAFGATLAFPLAAQAVPLGVAAPSVGHLTAENSNLIEVQQRMNRGGRAINRGGLRIRPGVRPGVVSRGGSPYRGGYRGYRYARPGYRNSNGFWFPPAAFLGGALLGGALAAQAAPIYGDGGGLDAQHYSWCEQRYISYRASDNSFQPYQGPREACNSPYS